MFRSSLLVVAILVAGASAAHAQATDDPQAVVPVVYSGTPHVPENCAGDANAEGCVPGDESPPVDEQAAPDYPPDDDYVPDYWEAPAYVAPAFYLGVSLFPDYWGWPYYGYGWGYGWPYYGYAAFGWPYYAYCCYWGGYWNSYAWHGHGHDHGGHGDHWGGHGGGDHGGWDHGGGDHGGHGPHGYPGPYRYLGHGQYANQIPGSGGAAGRAGDGQTRMAGTLQTQANTNPLARTGDANAFARGAARTAAFAAHPAAGPGRFSGRAVLPSASYYAAARSAGNPAFAADRGSRAANSRGSAASGYAYGRGNPGGASTANQGYRVTSLPNRGYASANYAAGRQSMARSGINIPSRSYPDRSVSYPQQRHAAANRAYAGPRGAAPSYYGARAMPSYSYSGRGAMPSYARGGGSYSAARGGNGGASAPHIGGSAHGGGHAGSFHGH